MISHTTIKLSNILSWHELVQLGGGRQTYIHQAMSSAPEGNGQPCQHQVERHSVSADVGSPERRQARGQGQGTKIHLSRGWLTWKGASRGAGSLRRRSLPRAACTAASCSLQPCCCPPYCSAACSTTLQAMSGDSPSKSACRLSLSSSPANQCSTGVTKVRPVARPLLVSLFGYILRSIPCEVWITS